MLKSKIVQVCLPRNNANDYSLVPKGGRVVPSAKVIADNSSHYANILQQWYIRPLSATPSSRDKVTLRPVWNPSLYLSLKLDLQGLSHSFPQSWEAIELSDKAFYWSFSIANTGSRDKTYYIQPYFKLSMDNFQLLTDNKVLTKGPDNATYLHLALKGPSSLQQWALKEPDGHDEASQKLIAEQPLKEEAEEAPEPEDSAE